MVTTRILAHLLDKDERDKKTVNNGDSGQVTVEFNGDKQDLWTRTN